MSEKIDLNNVSALVKGLAASLVAIISLCGSLWFFGEPFLERYVNNKIQQERTRIETEDKGKVKLRKLLSDKMGIPADEVHIEIGRLYQDEEEIWEEIDVINHKLEN